MKTRDIISDAMDRLAMALVNEKTVDVCDHVDALYSKLSQWISVDDRLPEREKKVLCTCEHYGVFAGVYTDSGECYEWFNNEEGVYIRSVPITHWMPLPQPSKQ